MLEIRHSVGMRALIARSALFSIFIPALVVHIYAYVWLCRT